MYIENDKGISELLKSEEEKRLCTGFTFTEGPIWITEDNCLLFSDIPGNAIHRWRPGSTEAETYRAPSGHANGLTLNHEGHLLACEHSGRRVTVAPYDGPAKTVVDHYQGKRFNSPNDIVVHSDGSMYFTDPDYGLIRPGMGDEGAGYELDHLSIYRVSPEGELVLLDSDFNKPNGLAFSPDESILYVADSGARKIYRYPMLSDGNLGDRDLFVDMSDDERFGVPDGMKVDEDGRLWTTGAGGVWVIEPDGTVLGQFETEEHAANIAFGGPDFSTLYLTAQTSVYAVETAVRGIAPGSR